MPATPPPETPDLPEPPQTFDMTVEEFCRRLSGDDRRVEMIAAFFADERANGHVKASEEVFRARYADFQTRPA